MMPCLARISYQRPSPLLKPRTTTIQFRAFVVQARRASGGRSRSNDGENRKKSKKGDSYENKTRRRGRPSWQRSPDDSPLRDGNRDRLMGLLTDRAAKTLLYYFFELNPTLYGWFNQYIKQNEIPRDGNWDDVSGETFLRKLLAMPTMEASWGRDNGFDSMYDCTGSLMVDPRNVAQRVMEVRSQLAKEMIQELQAVTEENMLLIRETISTSFSLENIAEPTLGVTHPEMVDLDSVDDSAGGTDD